MEISQKDGQLELRVQPRVGSVKSVSDLKVDGTRLAFVVSPMSAKGPEVAWDLRLSGDRLTGIEKRGGAEAGQVSGVRAPPLKRKPSKAWTTPEALFNGRDLAGWVPDIPSDNHWIAQDGVLLNEKKGANLLTVRKFEDFRLHFEENCPESGNSGIYLRGRYEVQIENEKRDPNDKLHAMGAIYGFIAPSVMLPQKPGQWESFDVTFIGRYVTIIRDGTKIIDDQEIPGITGGALDSNEGQPGPFYIQGDHTGGMKYRNITISVPKP